METGEASHRADTVKPCLNHVNHSIIREINNENQHTPSRPHKCHQLFLFGIYHNFVFLFLISLFLETKEDFPAILLPITRGQSRYSGFIPGGALMSSVLLSAIGSKLFITGCMHECLLRLSFQMFGN